MVIGDSLAQGTSTLSVTPFTTANCYSSILSKVRGWNFKPAELPRPIVFDLESEIVERLKNLTILGIFDRIRNNLKQWKAQLSGPRKNAPSYFDNLAIAGHSIDEMAQSTAATALNGIDDLFHQAENGSLIDLFNAALPLHLKINTSFVYNPSGSADYQNWTSLHWVHARCPKNLIVHFGHNDGLYKFGSTGTLSNLLETTLPKYLAYLKTLDDLPKKVGTIYVVLLPKISSVANLRPLTNSVNGYASFYEIEFPFPGVRVSGKNVKLMDDQIKQINREARALVAGSFKNPDRIRFIDTYKIFERMDFKNTGNSNFQIHIQGKKPVDNRYLHGSTKGGLGHPGRRPPKRYRYEWGGLQSLDGMHPGTLGYAAFAIEMMRDLDWFVQEKDEILQQAYQNEKLIKRYSTGGAHALKSLTSLIPKPNPGNDQEWTRNAIHLATEVFCR